MNSLTSPALESSSLILEGESPFWGAGSLLLGFISQPGGVGTSVYLPISQRLRELCKWVKSYITKHWQNSDKEWSSNTPVVLFLQNNTTNISEIEVRIDGDGEDSVLGQTYTWTSLLTICFWVMQWGMGALECSSLAPFLWHFHMALSGGKTAQH